jgi:hypothetical protein
MPLPPRPSNLAHSEEALKRLTIVRVRTRERDGWAGLNISLAPPPRRADSMATSIVAPLDINSGVCLPASPRMANRVENPASDAELLQCSAQIYDARDQQAAC